MPSLVTKLDAVLDTLFPRNESEILNQMISKFRSTYFEKYGVDPVFFTSSNINYIEMVAFSSRQYDLYFILKYLLKALLLPTTFNTFLDVWAGIKGVTRRDATQAKGKVTIPAASVGAVIQAGTQLQATSLQNYTVDNDVSSQTYQYTVASVTQTDTTVRYTLNLNGASSHGMYTGQVVTISGSVNPTYNGEKTITVISADTIEFQIPFVVTPDVVLTPLRVSFIGVIAQITSESYTSDANLTVGQTLSLLTPISGITEVGRVHVDGVLGGGSVETDDQFFSRVLDRFQKPYTRFNRNDVYDLLLQYDPNIVHYDVRQGYPNPTQAVIYVGKGGATVAQSQYTNGELTAFVTYLSEFTDIGVAPGSIDVQNYASTVVNVTVTGISPNSVTMTQALQVSIASYFEDLPVGADVKVDDLRGIIATTVSTINESPASFSVTAPSGTVVIPAYGRAYLGNLTLSTV